MTREHSAREKYLCVVRFGLEALSHTLISIQANYHLESTLQIVSLLSLTEIGGVHGEEKSKAQVFELEQNVSDRDRDLERVRWISYLALNKTLKCSV